MPPKTQEAIIRAHESDFRKHLKGTRWAKQSVGGRTLLMPSKSVTRSLFEVDFGMGNWHVFNYARFRSWSGLRRINRKIYNGRTFYTMSTKVSRPTELSH